MAVLRSVLNAPEDKAVARTARVLMEGIIPSGHKCPRCRSGGVVRNGSIKLHFAANADKRPCPASFKNVVDGVIL